MLVLCYVKKGVDKRRMGLARFRADTKIRRKRQKSGEGGGNATKEHCI